MRILSLILFFQLSLGYINIFRKYIRKQEENIPKKMIKYPKIDINKLSEQEKYDLQWYVIGESKELKKNKPFKATVWDNNYVIWKDIKGKYQALDDVCPHKAASLAGGEIINGNVMCPYHGYEFNSDGKLMKVPGMCFRQSSVYNTAKYDIVEKYGWVYLNVYDKSKNNETTTFKENIFIEEDAYNSTKAVYQNMEYNCYSRILSENSLDIMHIAYVHTFGNSEDPSPTYEDPPKRVGKYHYKTSYNYLSGKDSLANKIFDVEKLRVENEFILPHTTIARVYFGDFVSTVVTFAQPISENKCKLFVKTYRNFWYNPIGDYLSYYLMDTTMKEDKAIVENIDSRYQDGYFNMKFDKLLNTYKTLYKKFINDI